MIAIIAAGIIFILIGCVFIYTAFIEVLCNYRNPLPLFQDKGKRFNEIKIKKTRSIAEDIKYLNLKH